MIPVPESRHSTERSGREEGRTLRWGLGTWGACILYYATVFDRRWIPHDEGTLGQAAWRVLRGEVPHRDFDGMYTGLLDYVHAAAMSVVGVHLLTPRMLMFVAVMLWIPAVWSIGRKLTRSNPGAAATTILALLVGPANYPAAMPSWYNLFFATWGLWAILRWTETRRYPWLLATGTAAGLSILFKVTGLYLLAGVLFYLVHEECIRVEKGNPRSSVPSSRMFASVAAALVVTLVLMETALVWSQMGPATWISYVLPTALLGGALVWRALAIQDGGTALRAVLAKWMWVVSGVLIAVVPFLGWYAVSGALDDLYRGVFVLPAERLADVALPVPSLTRLWTIAIPAALFWIGTLAGPRLRIGMAVAVTLAMATMLLRLDARVFIGIFDSLLLIVPLVTAAGIATHVFARGDSSTDDRPLIATLWILALIHLIRYPFAVPMYFTYVAPLAVLAVGGVLARLRVRSEGASHRWMPRRPVLAAVVAAYAAFFVLGPNRGGLFGPLPRPAEALLPLERGRITIPIGEAAEYVELVEVVRDLTRSRYVYAGPDAPEVTFLAGVENPTRWLFEIFEEDDARTDRTLEALERHDVNVVVLNTRARFSSMSAELVTALATAYPHEMTVGRFLVRWSGPSN